MKWRRVTLHEQFEFVLNYIFMYHMVICVECVVNYIFIYITPLYIDSIFLREQIVNHKWYTQRFQMIILLSCTTKYNWSVKCVSVNAAPTLSLTVSNLVNTTPSIRRVCPPDVSAFWNIVKNYLLVAFELPSRVRLCRNSASYKCTTPKDNS